MALDDNDDGIVVLQCIQPYHAVWSCILYCPVFCTDWRRSTVLLCILQGSELKGALPYSNNGDDGQQETASISNLYLVSRIPITDIRALCPFQLDALSSYASTQWSDPAK